MIATAAMMPTSVLCRKAAAMSRPSRKLWMVSPTMMSKPLRPWSWAAEPSSCGPCTSQFSVWQCRQSSSFSSTKNTKIPPRIAAAASCALPRSNACGMTSRKAAPSSAPIAKETSVDTQLARRSSANAASPAESVPPTKLAARIQPSVSVMGPGILLGQPYERGHAAGGAVAPVGIEPLRIGVGAVATAEDALHAARAQPLARHGVEVEQPMAGACARKRRLGRGVAGEECQSDFVTDLIHLGADGGAEPCQQLFSRHAHRLYGVLDHTGGQAAPSRVRRTDYGGSLIRKKNRHAIGNPDCAHPVPRSGDCGVRLRACDDLIEIDHARPMHLPQP